MKFKSLNHIISASENDKISKMSQENIEAALLKLYHEEKKVMGSKQSLIALYQAMEVIDKLKVDFVAESSTDLRMLYFKGSSYQKKLRGKEVPKPFLTKVDYKKYHFTKPTVKSINEIHELLVHILNNEVFTVHDGQYLMIRGKQNYRLKDIEKLINDQVKVIFKNKKPSQDEIVNAIECYLYLKYINPKMFSNLSRTSKHNYEKLINYINADEALLNSLKSLFNARASEINDSLFTQYNLIDWLEYKSDQIDWNFSEITDNFKKPTIELNVEKAGFQSTLLNIMTLNDMLNLDLHDDMLKGRLFVPLIYEQNIKNIEVLETFVKQSIIVNYELKVAEIFRKYKLANEKLERLRNRAQSVVDDVATSDMDILTKDRDKLKMELDILRSVPLTEQLLQSMILYRNSLAKYFGIHLTPAQQKGSEPYYFTRKDYFFVYHAYEYLIPHIVNRIKYFVEGINYSIEFTELRRTWLKMIAEKLDPDYVASHLNSREENSKLLNEAEARLIAHTNDEKGYWSGERRARMNLARLLSDCNILGIDLDLAAIDNGQLINLEKELQAALKYPGFEVLQAGIAQKSFSGNDLELLMSEWPQEWRDQYNQALEMQRNANQL